MKHVNTEIFKDGRERRTYALNCAPLQCCKVVMQLSRCGVIFSTVNLSLVNKNMHSYTLPLALVFEAVEQVAEQAVPTCCYLRGCYAGRTLEFMVEFEARLLRVVSDDADVLREIDDRLQKQLKGG